MIICPICGVQLHTSAPAEEALANHRKEQHAGEKPVLTFRQGFDYALKMIPADQEEGPDKKEAEIIARLKREYEEPE